MKRLLRFIGIIVALLVLGSAWPAWLLYGEINKASSEDPLVWEDDIRILEQGTAGKYAPGEGIVFIGSSSIRLWSSIARDMAPLPVIQHGFGGAKLNDLVHYAPRLVSAYRPRAVVVFAGTNDIDPQASKEPAVLLASYQAFVDRVRRAQPQLPIFYIAITPSPRRWPVWPIAQETNRLIAGWSATQPGLYFIDTAGALLGPDGEPARDMYIFDGLHLSQQGYRAWTQVIRPRLLAQLGVAAGG